jgi:SAM-dependent methyltransferase
MADTCPICDAASLDATAESFSVAEILRRWQTEAGVTFRRSVWEHYTGRAATPDVTLHRCRRCGFAIFRPVLVGTTEFYEGITTTGESPYYTVEKWEFRQAVKDLKSRGCRRVLDIGAGQGHFLDLLRRELPGGECAGVEFNEEMAQRARARGHTVYLDAAPDVLTAAGAGGLFDAVCMFQVIEHVDDPLSFIGTALRLLKPGGLLILSVPDNAGPVRHFSADLTELPPHHVSRWRASTFEIGLPRLGLEVLRTAREPLPRNLWRDYIPVMLEHTRLPKRLVRALSGNNRLVRVLNRTGLKQLPGVPGLSLYVVSRSAGGG